MTDQVPLGEPLHWSDDELAGMVRLSAARVAGLRRAFAAVAGPDFRPLLDADPVLETEFAPDVD